MNRRSVVIAAVIVAALASCSDGKKADAPPSYVALGDSAVSGPMIDPPDPLAPPECFRSERNYPHLVAEGLGTATFEDVSCGGATTDSVRNTRKNGQTQLEALGAKTQIVTVGIGANDAGLASAWFKYCFLDSRTDALCNELVSTYAPTYLSQTRVRVAALLKEVKHRSPHAKVLLVGLLRFAPDEGSCDALPISEANRAASVGLERDFAAMQRSAASDAKVGYVDMRALSKGHDACAGDKAWVNGLTSGDGMYLHPKTAGMEAVADEVLRVVRGE